MNSGANQDKNFMISFQKDLNVPDLASSDVWVEYKNKIVSTKEFTVCHWIKIRYFNLKYAACLWSYCVLKTKDTKMKCLRLCLNGVWNTANRNVVLLGQIPSNQGTKYTSAIIEESAHRKWTLICWSFSIFSGESSFYRNGNLIKIEQLNVEGMEYAIMEADGMVDSAFIFGQEPDIIRGAYDKNEAFLGDLVELNIWSRILNVSDIERMGSCYNIIKGDVLAWVKSNFNIYNADISIIKDTSQLCERPYKYMIFPEKLSYPNAIEICKIHGGWLALPKSAVENQKMIDIVLKHRKTCTEDTTSGLGNVVWIGAGKWNQKWYELDENGRYGNLLNYTNVFHSGSTPTSDCAYLQSDGAWLDASNVCKKVSLCTICLIKDEPIFTMKGVCSLGEIDWNYYIDINKENYEVNMYEGYKRTNIEFDKRSKSWNISLKANSFPQSFDAVFMSNDSSTPAYPVGRNTWTITECGADRKPSAMTLSACKYPTQFTCDSGHCININKRCDEHRDCDDGTDEKSCLLVDVPISYNQANKPDSDNGSYPLKIQMETKIITIDSIDTVDMIVSLTMEIRMKWHDKRLTFFNPELNKSNVIPHAVFQKLWNPLQETIHDNAVIGEIIHDNKNILQLQANIPEEMDPQEAVENRIFNGSFNYLDLIQRMKVKYNCIFDVTNFPFDGKDCHFILKMKQRKENEITFQDQGNVIYNGVFKVGQFSIGKMETIINNTKEYTTYTIIIPMNRIFTNQILTTFIPTLILWLYGYSTMFIDPDCYIDRFRGAGTALLVVATFFNAIHGDLPQTSYVKLIDLWFVVHVISIFLMIAYHVVLGRLKKYFEKQLETDCLPFSTFDPSGDVKVKAKMKISSIDRYFVLIFPFLNIIFYVVYLYSILNQS